MAGDDGERKLTVIMSADAVGYSRLMEDDERATVRTLTDHRAVLREHIERHKGRVVDSPGDNLLAEFASPVEAVEAAVEIQRALAASNAQLAEHRRMAFRIGINLGDVIEQDGALFGDGINIAARLETLAETGGICLSGTAFDQVKSKLPYGFDYFGEQSVKNITEPVRAYRVVLETQGDHAAARRTPTQNWKWPVVAATVVLALITVSLAVWQRMAPDDKPQTARGVVEDIPALPMPVGPTIAVLPFKNLSGDPNDEYFSDGLTEDIILGLLKFHEFRVAAADATFKYKETEAKLQHIAHELGAHYLLEGSVRRSGDTIRVSAKLLDAQSVMHVWGETYERDMTPENIFAVQDEITSQVIATIADSWGILSSAGLQQVRSEAPDSLESYECLMKVYDFYRTMEAATHFDVRACLEATVERDPDYADAWSWLANVYNEEHAFEFNTRPDPLDRSLEAALRAVELDPRSFIAYAGLADVYFFRGEKQAFMAAAKRALELNPNHATRVALIGIEMAYFGDWDRGLALVERGISLNPDHPGWVYTASTLNHFRLGEFELAATSAERMGMPDWIVAVMFRAAAYGQLGQTDKARANIEQLLKLDPDFQDHPRELLRKHHLDTAIIDIIIEGLRKGGLDISTDRVPTN